MNVTGPGGNSGKGLKAEINVTPLVDVVLVLLIIFMVVTPMLTRGKEVRLPIAGASEAESSSTSHSAVVLTVTADRQIWLDRRPIRQARLKLEIERLFAANRSQEVLIKADAGVMVRDLRPLLTTLKAAGAQEIAFAVLGEKADHR
jgi:biopolymer transport protein TolR